MVAHMQTEIIGFSGYPTGPQCCNSTKSQYRNVRLLVYSKLESQTFDTHRSNQRTTVRLREFRLSTCMHRVLPVSKELDLAYELIEVDIGQSDHAVESYEPLVVSWG